jgi:hypothetical protein
MRKILSERNFAAILFVLVIVAFSFAHEDSKKRSLNYNLSSITVAPGKPATILSDNSTSKKSNTPLNKNN